MSLSSFWQGEFSFLSGCFYEESLLVTTTAHRLKALHYILTLCVAPFYHPEAVALVKSCYPRLPSLEFCWLAISCLLMHIHVFRAYSFVFTKCLHNASYVPGTVL